MDGFDDLIMNASVRVYQHGIDRRAEMEQRGRQFPFYVMSYISQGQAQLCIDGQSHQLLPGSVILISPNVRHDHIMNRREQTVFWWWHFDYKLYNAIDLLGLLRLPVTFQISDKTTFEGLFQQYSHAMTLPPTLNNTLHKRACMLEVMGRLLGEAEQANLAHDPRTAIPETFLDMLETIVSGGDEKLSLAMFAAKYKMNPTYLTNRFTKYFGVSPVKLYRRLRMERATDLLESGRYTIAEIAQMLGYSDAAVFSRAYSSLVGTAPSKVARQACSHPQFERF